MSESFHLRQEVFPLLHRMRDDELSADDAERLKLLLTESDEARRMYVEYSAMLAAMRWSHVSHENTPSEEISITAPAMADSTVRFPRIQGRINHSWQSGILTKLVVAASIYGVFIALVWNLRPDAWVAQVAPPLAQATLPPATLSAANGCEWDTAETAPNAGEKLGTNLLRLTSGIAELTFDDGARVVIEGPATFSALGTGSLDFQFGRLTASVPPQAVGFTVSTPAASVVDLGTEFGVTVNREGATDVHVLRGAVEYRQLANESLRAGAFQLRAGEAVRLPIAGGQARRVPLERERFVALLNADESTKPTSETNATDTKTLGDTPAVFTIFLGNLFDDPSGTSLTEAMTSDTFRAAADEKDLGVERVTYGGPAEKFITANLRFDFRSLGWQQESFGHVANDAWTDRGTLEIDNSPKGGIRTRGEAMGEFLPKVDEGIGAHANCLITFDLSAIRKAGGFDDKSLTFVCDRGGVNDDRVTFSGGSVHLVAIVSGADAVQSVAVDGAESKAKLAGGVWTVIEPPGKPLRSGGPFANFKVPLTKDAQYLTLVATSAGDDTSSDHAVWPGARIIVSE